MSKQLVVPFRIGWVWWWKGYDADGTSCGVADVAITVGDSVERFIEVMYRVGWRGVIERVDEVHWMKVVVKLRLVNWPFLWVMVHWLDVSSYIAGHHVRILR